MISFQTMPPLAGADDIIIKWDWVERSLHIFYYGEEDRSQAFDCLTDLDLLEISNVLRSIANAPEGE